MTQNPASLVAKCRACGAAPGRLCITQYEEISERVHVGRLHWSDMAVIDPSSHIAPLTDEQKRERWERLIEGSEAA